MSKVARTVIMGGEYPRASAPEWNFGLDLDATRRVVRDWPGRVSYDGFEVGARVWLMLPGRARANAVIRWTAGDKLGAEFAQPISLHGLGIA